jgi:hypothetical protein
VRQLHGLGILGVSFFLVAPAWAQQHTASFTGISPADVKNQPVNVSKALAAPLPTAQGSGFSLSKIMPHVSLTNFFTGSHYGVSPLPPASSFPSTHYKSPIKPMAPIAPRQ